MAATPCHTPDRGAITLTALRYHVALAEHHNFRRAADACHVSQPTLSEQVRKLEDVLGTSLVERGRSARLTPAGEGVVERARRMLAELDAMVEEVTAVRAPLTGTLRLGIIPTLGPYLLPTLLPALRKRCPSLRLLVHEGVTASLLVEVVEHRLDAALVALPASLPGLVSRALLREPFLVLVPMGHALSKQAAIDAEDLNQEELLLLTEGHCLRDQALAVCGTSRATTSPGHDFRATSLETLARLVAAGFGVTLVPTLAANIGSGVVTRPLLARGRGAGNAEHGRTLGLVWRKSHARPRDIAALGDLLIASRPRGLLVVAAGA